MWGQRACGWGKRGATSITANGGAGMVSHADAVKSDVGAPNRIIHVSEGSHAAGLHQVRDAGDL